MKLTSRHYALLGKAFAKEPFPMQTRSAMGYEMEDAGLLYYTTVPHRNYSNTTISGWCLTHAGRISYCAWVAKQAMKAAG